MRVPHDSLVLVADGRKRLFFRNTGTATEPALSVVEAAEDDNPATRDQTTDAPGRASSPVGHGSTTLAGADAHQVEELRFAAETAQLLAKRAQSDDFESLVIVAPAKTLGELRKHYDPAMKARLIGELAKDLTGHPVDRIVTALTAHEAPQGNDSSS